MNFFNRIKAEFKSNKKVFELNPDASYQKTKKMLFTKDT